MAAFRAGVLAAAILAVSAGYSAAADRAIIVLDASGSMWGQIDGKPKLQIARETLRTVLQTVPADLELGLIAYGHRQKGVCSDIELVVPPGAGTGQAIADAADKMRFLGMTPLSNAVKQAAESLRYTEEKATVILITDGIETCDADPCALGKELEQAGVDFTAHVVGFGLSQDEGRQVACLAENTGGRYLPAGDAGSLADALTQTVVAAPEPEPEPEPQPAPEPVPAVEFNFAPTLALAEDTDDLGDSGQAWVFHTAKADGTRGEYVRTEYGPWKGNVEPGDYVVVATLGRAETEQRVTVKDGEAAAPHFILNAGTILIRPLGAEGEEPRDGAAVNFKYPGGETTEYGQAKAVVPAGAQTVTVTIGMGVAVEQFALKVGETVEKTMIAGVGHVVANASYVEGMKIDAGGLAVRIFKAAKRIDGTREDVTYGYGPDTGYDLPAGDYVLHAKMDEAEGEGPFSVKVGERTEANVVINAGVLAIKAPEAKELRVYKAARDIQGNRVSAAYSYDAEFQTTLNAGDYVVVAYRGDERTETEVPVTIKAGERAEIAVP
jgi:Ca-activated chloride channel family protein